MRVAIDAMGGDYGVESNVKGALIAADKFSDLEIILVGDEQQISPYLLKNLPNISIRHCTGVILGDEEPVKAVRSKKDSSLVRACKMVKDNEADACVSAGNTGALMTASLLYIGRIKGVLRPALAPILPTLDGIGVLALDLGANIDPKPEHLAQYALLGTIYREKIHNISKPRVGLLNIGTEPTKGNDLVKSAYPLLEKLPIHFIGNVEARELLERTYDVLVCDGFSGNILLKTLEGTAQGLLQAIKQNFMHSWVTKLCGLIMNKHFGSLKESMNYKHHGGAPLLGINGVVIKAHGSSDDTAIFHAIRQARVALTQKLIAAFEQNLKESE